jgi:hypothetical protein
VHAFLEEIDATRVQKVAITYPVHPAANPRRFLVEAYPLAALLEGTEIMFGPGGPELFYHVRTESRDGNATEHTIFAPNRLAPDHLGEMCLSPTGWLRVAHGPDAKAEVDEALETEIETLFREVTAAIERHQWPADEPFCERLAIEVTVAGIERPIRYGDEVMSTREALHEDLYFTVAEIFKRRAGRPPGDRGLRPGQIVPNIRAGQGDAQVLVALHGYGEIADPPRPEQSLALADRALALAQIRDELDRLPGERFEARSCEGRPVLGLHRRGVHPPVLVTAGQHANETSGIVGALRAARQLLIDPAADVALIPLENPDGYVLHEHLSKSNPGHILHAARYTALGNDLDLHSGEEPYEKAARVEALARSGARLHINLHGYPAHEWTRPLTGYLPRGFELWSIPKGFFLIMRHHLGWAEQGRALVEAVTAALAAVPGLVAFNRRQMEVCTAHSGEMPYGVINDVPCVVSEDSRHPTPLTLITEFPDETISGDAFRFAHTVQMATVLAAQAAYVAMTETVGSQLG